MKQQQRYYAAVTASKSDIESRVLAVCKAFDKITADKVTYIMKICSSILNSLFSKTQTLIAVYLWCREIPKKSFHHFSCLLDEGITKIEKNSMTAI